MILRLFFALVLAVALVFPQSKPASAINVTACVMTDYTASDGKVLFAAYINPDDSLVPADVDATTTDVFPIQCDIGIYYNAGSHSLGNATTGQGVSVHGATYFGILVNGENAGSASLTIVNSSVYDIGDNPTFSGVQHGVGIAYVRGATGSVTNTNVYEYQKNGFLADGANTNVTITGSIFRGLGPVPFIAQNGVQFSRGAAGGVSNSTMEYHEYTGCPKQDDTCVPYVSAGLLIYQTDPSAVNRHQNLYRYDDANVVVVQPAN